MKLNQKIQAFLTKKKYKKHRLALRCMMSFMVALCVVGNLIMPAISMTLESLDPSYSLKNDTVTYLSSESTPPSSAPDAIDLTPTAGTQEKFEMNIEDEYGNIIYNNFDGTVTGSGSTDNVEKVGLTFFLHYLKPEVSVTVNDAADLYLNLKDFLGSGTKFVLDDNSKSGDVLDEAYFTKTGNQSAGEYVFTEDGYILIYLTPEYIAYINSEDGDGSLEGTLTFTGTLSRSDDASGDQTFNIGGQEVKVEFPDKKAQISEKWGNVNDSNGTITWTVKIDNKDLLNLSSYNFTDTMLDQATSVTFNPSDAATFDNGSKKITFNSNSANSGTITITYTTPVTNGQLAAGSVSNTATLTNGSDSSAKSSSVNLNDKKPVNISKNGVQDYTSGTYGKTIDWTITLDNTRGVSLDGYVLTDNMLASAISGSVEVSPAGSIAQDGTLTGVGNAKQIIIKYQTTAEPGKTYNNKVSLSYPVNTNNPNNNKPADDKEKEVIYDTESNLITLNKGYWVTQENGVGVVQWTITINTNKLDLTGYKVTDKMIAQAIKDGYDVSVSAGAEIKDNEIVFNSESKNHDTINVVYKTKITSEDLKNGGVSNEATLKDKDSDTPVKDPVKPTAPLGTPHLNVNKSVSADYEKGTYGNTLNWTINIQSTYGVSLENFIVKDPMLTDAVLNTVTISPAGSLTPNGDGTYKLTGVGDANNIQIKYSTEAAANTYYDNAADVYYPGDNPSTDNKVSSSGDSTADITYKDEGGLYGVTKWGNVTNQEDGEITWQITITPSGGISLDGFEVYDAKFPVNAEGKPDLEQITFNPSSAKEYATADKTADGKLAIKFGDYKGNVTLTYKEYLADGVSGQITNSVSNNKNNTVATSPVTYTERNTLDKNLNTWPNPDYIKSNAKIEKILDWKTSITYDGSLVNKTYTDTLSVNSTSSASHTITDAQLDAILIYAKRYNWENPGTKLVAGTDYTVQNNGNTGFTITFLDTEANKNYNYIDISYKTTAVADAYTGSYDSSNQIAYTFGNKAQFNNNTDEDNKYVVNRQNPETHNVMNINAVKNWENANSITKPANVQMVLMHSVNYGEWLPVKGSGTNYILSTYDAYSSTDGVYTITLTESGSWRAALNNIPQKDVFAKADGTPGEELNYRYKLAEITPDGVTLLEGNIYEYGDGYFQIVETNNNGIGWAGDMTITNKYYPEKSLTPRKIWEGDEGKSSQISSITYQLQYSLDYNNWYPVKKDDTTGEYVYDANGSTMGATIVTQELKKSDVNVESLDNGNKIRWTGEGWTELPGMIVVDGNVREIHYRIREVAVDGAPIPANKQFTVSNGYYQITTEGTDTITNKFIKTVDNTINAEKLWSDETHILDGVIVQLQRKGNDTNTWEAYGENVVLNADNSWKTSWSLPNQSIDAETGKIVTYTYRVVEIGYVDGENHITGIIDNNNQFAVDADGFYEVTYSTENNEWSWFDKNLKEFSSGGSVYIKNTFTSVNYGSITPKKQWAGEEQDDITKDRPEAVVFTLQYKLGNSNDWITTDKTVTLTSANATNDGNLEWQGDIFDNLPAEKITVNADGTFTKESYTYRLVETGYIPHGGTTVTTLPTGEDTIKTENGRYEITISNGTGVGQTQTVTNTFKESIGIIKTIIDKNGNKLTSIGSDELINYKYTIDGVDYYIFNWVIEFESGKTELYAPLVDDLPEGFTLCTLSEWENKGTSLYWGDTKHYPYTPLTNNYTVGSETGYYKHPTMMFIPTVNTDADPNNDNSNGGANPTKKHNDLNQMWTTTSDYYYYDTENGKNRVVFNKPSTSTGFTFHVGYSTKIECEKFDEIVAKGSYTVTNNAVKYDNTGKPTEESASASLKIVNKVPKDLITKTYEPTLIPGYVQFSLDINPEARNLSSGATIDIQDLFKTLDYYDHDYGGGQWWTGANSDKLVDIIMNSIKLYEVDANGNRVELASNKYTLILDTGDNVDGGSALLQLQIPDETHIQVDYVYKLIANENTPSVIRGCKSSTRVNGRYVKMTPGLVPPAGDKVKFTNVASLKTDSAADESTVSGQEYEISSSSGTISTNALPSIKKVNTGDYTINDLDAKFLFAKYENGKWYYATSIDEKKRTATWTVTGVTGSAVPTDETLAEIHVQEAYEVALDQNTLYKLVEIKVPDDYEGSNLGFADPATEFKAMILDYLNYGRTYFNNKDYSIFLNHYISTHYFVYNSTLAAYPSEVDADDVMLIKAGGDIEIPNNQLIDINVKKQWINPTADVTDSSITVELYWSYTKSSTGYPTDMKLATVEDLGLMQEDFSATKTIAVSDDAAEAWTQLPNGIGGKPIYYYIKETAYTIGGVTYTNDNDPENPSFKSESGDVCAFYPTYVGNAANDDETIINVNNSQQLMLKKVWKNSANDPMIVIPTDKVIVSIYGIDSDGVKTETPLFENIELSASNNWTADLTSLLASNNALYEYVAYEAEESAGTTLDDYVVSCTFNINSSTGEIVVTNKNTAPTDASVTVSKEWSDGSALHNNETIKVTLYQSDREITNLSNLSGTIAALGTPKMSKINEDDTQEYEVYLNKDNNWTVTWTGLPLDNGDPSNPTPYYYYVLEDMSPTEPPEGFTAVSNADKYSAKYEITDGTATRTVFEVTNTRQAIVVEKVWRDENGNTIADSDLPQSSIEVEVYKKVASVPEGGVTIATLGDSITEGYSTGYDGAYGPYLKDILEGAPYKYTVNKLDCNGHSQHTIQNTNTGRAGIFEKLSSDLNGVNPNIVCLMIGTNDIIDNLQDGIDDRLEELIIGNSSTNGVFDYMAEDGVLFLASIPKFRFVNKNNSTTTCHDQNWFSRYPERTSMSASDFENYINNTVIKNYNDKIKALVEKLSAEGYQIRFVDVYAEVDIYEHIVADGCHPNDAGDAKIATVWANSIAEYYTQDGYVGEATLSAANGWKTAIDISDTDTSVKYYITEKNVPNGWQVTYSPESITLGSSTPITITNTKHIPVTSVPVIKTWALDDGDESGRDAIQLSLLRSIDRTNWEEVDVTLPTLVKEDNQWTFTFTDLPAEDNAGNQYYYMVEEGALPGYTVKYGTVITEAVDDGTANALTLTNTRAISLVVQKDWSDIDENDHINDIVKLKIYRTTKTEEISTDPTLILDIVSNIALGVGEDKTVSANKALASVEITAGAEVITAEIVNGQLKIKGVADGTAKLTVTDEDGETAEMTVNVSSYDLYEKVGDTETKLSGTETITLNLGDNTHQLLIKKSGANVDYSNITFTSSDSNVISVTDDGIISTLKPGEATITAEVDGFTFTQTYRAILHDGLPFTISGASEVVKGETLTSGLTVNNNYGCTVVWSIADEHAANATITQDGKVTGITITNDVKVIATITDQFGNSISAEHLIDVVNGDIWENDNVVVKVPVGETVTITSATSMSQFDWHDGSIVQSSVSGNTITLVGVKAGTVQLTVNNSGWNDKTTFTVIVYDKFTVTPATKTLEYGGSVTLTPNTTDTVTYSVTSGADLISISGHTITANSGKEGTATVTATNTATGETCTVTINVVAEILEQTGTLTSGSSVALSTDKFVEKIEVYVTEHKAWGGIKCELLTDGNTIVRAGAGYGFKTYDTSKWEQDNNTTYIIPTGVTYSLDEAGKIIFTFDPAVQYDTLKITQLDQYSSCYYTVTYANTSSASFSLRNTSLTLGDAGTTEILADEDIAPLAEDSRALVSNLTFVAIAGNSETEVANVDIELTGTGADKWLAEIDNLPAQDESGNTYYYWVEEVPVFSNYEVSYLFRDNDDTTSHMINATQKSDNDVDIVVRNTKQNNVTVEMPSTGGEGTTNYYIVGIIMMLVGAAALIVFKRRQKVER